MLETTMSAIDENHGKVKKRRQRVKQSGKRITIVLPEDIAEQVAALIPIRQRSKYIADAISEKIAEIKQNMLNNSEAPTDETSDLDEFAGIWTDENHPDMLTEEDIDRWLDKIRGRCVCKEKLHDQHPA